MCTLKTIKSLLLAGFIGISGILAGCGGGGAGGSATPTTGKTVTYLLLATSATSVNSDNLNPATITATVLDANRAPVSDVALLFTSSSSGQLGVSSGVSSSSGIVTIPFSSGTTNKTNRTETINVSSPNGVTAQIPIQVIGSTITLTPSSNSAVVGGTPVSLNVVIEDASSLGISGQSLRLSIPAGNGSLTGGAGTTLSQTVTSLAGGISPTITYTPAIAGNVQVTADWLDSTGNVTQSANTSIAVSAPGIQYSVTNPSSATTSVTLAATQPVTVSVPTSISGITVTNVRFSTTLGTWSNGAKVRTLAASDPVNEVFSAGSSSGTANIQIDALDVNDTVLATLNRIFQLSASPASAGDVTLQAGVSNIAPSSAGTNPSTTLTATVRTGPGGNVVGNAPVLFEIMNPTGSGEQITPVILNTDSNGRAIATFYSGSLPTVGGLKIKASLLGTNPACDNLAIPPIAGLCDVKTINVNTLAVSVSLGTASRIESVNNNTNYNLPMSVLVVDSSGAAVNGAVVSLSAFPTRYYEGTRNPTTCAPTYTGNFSSEDTVLNNSFSENDNLDPGEDVNGNGTLTPAHANAGTLPSTVTTDVNGVAAFSLIYQKEYSSWVQTRVRAKVVIGAGTTESTNELKIILPYSTEDASPTCSLPHSPADW